MCRVAPGLGVGVVRELAGEVKVAPTRVLALELCGAFYLSLGNISLFTFLPCERKKNAFHRILLVTLSIISINF